MPFYDCVISINVHEKPDFLKRQLDNIKENVSCKYAVVLNCNDFMFEECGKIELPDNVYIHPEPLNKNTFHGSLMHGIYNNMVFSLHHFQFDFFIVASSRTCSKMTCVICITWYHITNPMPTKTQDHGTKRNMSGIGPILARHYW